MKIGVFGGTFNPPHVGHVNIASSFARRFDLSKVLIIPTYTPPHKISPNLASAEDRIELCRRSFCGDEYQISDMEIKRQGKSYTYDTLLELKEEGTEIYFLVGDDMLLTLHEWKNPEGILELCKVVATVRSEQVGIEVLKQYVTDRYPNQYNDGRFEFLEISPIDISSTEIRKRIKAGEDIKGLVTAETEAYILDRRLYHD